jgi:hypothetical protein
MSKKKGLSIEEKILKVEEFFKEHQQPFTLKELEALIPKAKGVIYQSVLECVTLLVAEGRVQTEKIGVFTLFWHFNATQSNLLVSQLEEARRSVVTNEERVSALRRRVDAKETAMAAAANADGDARATVLDEIAALAAQQRQLQARAANAADNDPSVYRDLLAGITLCRDGANRWTDNIFTLEYIARRRMGMPPAEFRRRHAIPEDLDFIESAL